MKYVICVGVIRKGQVIIKTNNNEEVKVNVQSR